MKYWGVIKFNMQECIQWEYDLFVVQSLKGGIVEKFAMSELRNRLQSYSFVEAEGYLDEELRIDIIIQNNGKEIAGI